MGLFKCLGRLAWRLGSLCAFHASLELTHAKVEVGDEEDEQVFTEGNICLELNLWDFLHHVQKLSFDTAEGALCRT